VAKTSAGSIPVRSANHDLPGFVRRGGFNGTRLEQAYLNQRSYLGMEKTELYHGMCRRRVYEAEQEQMKRLAE
jgi:hypothetical protein